jgi:hypothetical protein
MLCPRDSVRRRSPRLWSCCAQPSVTPVDAGRRTTHVCDLPHDELKWRDGTHHRGATRAGRSRTAKSVDFQTAAPKLFFGRPSEARRLHQAQLQVQVKAPAVTHELTVRQITRWIVATAVTPEDRVRED